MLDKGNIECPHSPLSRRHMFGREKEDNHIRRQLPLGQPATGWRTRNIR